MEALAKLILVLPYLFILQSSYCGTLDPGRSDNESVLTPSRNETLRSVAVRKAPRTAYNAKALSRPKSSANPAILLQQSHWPLQSAFRKSDFFGLPIELYWDAQPEYQDPALLLPYTDPDAFCHKIGCRKSRSRGKIGQQRCTDRIKCSGCSTYSPSATEPLTCGGDYSSLITLASGSFRENRRLRMNAYTQARTIWSGAERPLETSLCAVDSNGIEYATNIFRERGFGDWMSHLSFYRQIGVSLLIMRNTEPSILAPRKNYAITITYLAGHAYASSTLTQDWVPASCLQNALQWELSLEPQETILLHGSFSIPRDQTRFLSRNDFRADIKCLNTFGCALSELKFCISVNCKATSGQIEHLLEEFEKTAQRPDSRKGRNDYNNSGRTSAAKLAAGNAAVHEAAPEELASAYSDDVLPQSPHHETKTSPLEISAAIALPVAGVAVLAAAVIYLVGWFRK